MGRRLQEALLYWRTMRHLKASQIYWRLRYRTGKRRPHRYGVPCPIPPLCAGARDGLRGFASHWAAAAPPDPARTSDFLRGRFTFLNKTIQSTRPLWHGLDVPRLWMYNLHYFDFARDIAILHPDPESPGAERIREWLEDWMDKNTNFDTVAWDAFPLSVRLVNWSLIVAIYGWEDSRLIESMHIQLDYLRQHLERDLRGNHLLKNAVALTVAGALLGSPCGKMGLSLLKREVRAQFLPDGGHSERSMMYHGQLLVDLLLARAVLEPNPDWLAEATQRALGFLHGLTHGDGLCAQFNDGAAEEAPAPPAIQALAKKFYWGIAAPDASTAYVESGFYRMAPGDNAGLLIAKAGDATVNHQPGHAHSDLLSFEYSLGEQRIFVNAGTHGYAESPHRDFCRSTAAHNTLRINGQEQLENWSTFRVARRVHATVSHWDAGAPALRAVYQTFQGPRHERSFHWDPRGWWRIVDIVSGGDLTVDSFLHLHPDCAVEPGIDLPAESHVRVFRILGGGHTLDLLVTGATGVSTFRGQEDRPQGWYFPRFGAAVPSTTLVMRATGGTEVRMGFALLPDQRMAAEAARDLARAAAGRQDHG